MATLVRNGSESYIKDHWYFEDFQNVADQNEWSVSNDKLLEAMEYVADNYDCNYGITWDTIERAIAEVM